MVNSLAKYWDYSFGLHAINFYSDHRLNTTSKLVITLNHSGRLMSFFWGIMVNKAYTSNIIFSLDKYKLFFNINNNKIWKCKEFFSSTEAFFIFYI